MKGLKIGKEKCCKIIFDNNITLMDMDNVTWNYNIHTKELP